MTLTVGGRTAIVTGASSGIGAAVARRLAAEGARVGLLARRADELGALADGRGGAEVVAVSTDVADDDQVRRAVDTVRERFGTVDLAVLAAGSYAYGPVAEARLEDWRATVDSSLWGTALVTRHLVGDLVAAAARGPADVVCFSSVAASSPFPGFALYGAAKAGVEQFAAALRAELGPAGVRVCALELGLVATGPALAFAAGAGRTPPALQPEDVADLVAYAASRPSTVSFNHVRLLPTAQV